MKNKTPLLRPLRDKGATLYVFPSANEDIGLNLDSRTTGVSLSHYALLNLPGFTSTNTTKLGTQILAEDLQNYVMNFETVLLNQDSYNYQDYHTVSERVFWHWMHNKIQHINYTSIKNSEYLQEEYTETTNNQEESDDRVVVCFGSIDAGNSLTTEFGIFNETYINIPTSYGAGPVFFKQNNYDSNYKANYKYIPTDSTVLEGRTKYESGGYINTIPQYDESSIYKTGTIYDGIEILKDIPEIQKALQKYMNNTNISINSYDDINVDLQNQFNLTNEFKFNAILLYYSIYDQDDTTKSPYAINLFGIIFLDGPIKSSSNNLYYIPQFIKKKSNDGYFGNSYSFRVNIKTLSVYDNSDAVIQDNTTLSSIYSLDFSDVISNLNRAIDTMNTNVHTTMAIQNAYMNILTYYDEQRENIKDLSTQLNSLINGSNTNQFNTSTLTVNTITPNIENGVIMQQVYKEYNDYTDSLDNEIYTQSIITRNNHNIPAVYYPQVDTNIEFSSVNNIIQKTDSNINQIINAIDIIWYTNENKLTRDGSIFTYPIINVDKSILQSTGATDLIDSSNNINYNLLTTYLIDYVQELNKPELSDDEFNKLINNTTFINKISNNINNNVSGDISSLQTNITNNSNSISTLQSQINQLINENNKNIADINTSISELKNSAINGDTTTLSAQIKTNSANIISLSDKINNIILYNNTIDKNISNINSSLGNINSSINKLKNNIDSLFNDNEVINTQINDIWKAINGHTQTLTNFKQHLENIDKKLNEILAWKTM